jgi:hypothetical protein
MMTAQKKAEYLAALADVQAGLDGTARSSETQVELAANSFKRLAGQAETILNLTAAIVGCVETERMGSVLPAVQSLCESVNVSMDRKMDAANSILVALNEEEDLLKKLTQVTQRQVAISAHLEALSVLTNVEVARLGSVGGDFRFLAQELSSFSKAIVQDNLELEGHTEKHTLIIKESREELAASLPQLRGELDRMEAEIGKTLQAIGADLVHLSSIPGQFRSCAEETSQQIGGVVAAIQAHDITRQQMEHVQQALQMIASAITSAEDGRGRELPLAYAGLTIQAAQLKNIKEITARWTSQITVCMDGIRQLSVSELVRIGPAVLKQERELTAHLSQIESLQQKSREYGARVRGTLAGLSSLLELVQEHLQRSQRVRHRLQLLTFNSLIEAHRLGRLGAVVSAIANLIKEVSAEWGAIATRSSDALAGIMRLVKHTNEVMEEFSEDGRKKLRADQEESVTALNRVRGTAEFVAGESVKMQDVTGNMQADLDAVSETRHRLNACFGPIETALAQVECVARGFEADDPQVSERYDPAEAERLFSGFYTTEIERHVLIATLRGTPMPVLEQSLAGNNVELF